ncbi:MAG: hypothetical protein NT031_10745, partial [Planctomycetota bacterium]|nr:hypothetical protein [Planctomycetota bacterium]
TEVQPEQTKVEAAAQTDGGGTPLADPVPAMRVKAAAETRRLEAVAKACGGKHPDIEAKAIEEGWDVTRTELEVLRAERPALPNVQTNDNPPPTAQILEAALCLSGGLQAVEKAYEPTILEAADRSFRSMGVQERRRSCGPPGAASTSAASCPTSPTSSSWKGSWRPSRPGRPSPPRGRSRTSRPSPATG